MFITIFAALLMILPAMPAIAQDQDIPEKYHKWLQEEVVYIISDKEEELFTQLGNNSQRNRFIEEFWLERDPSPGSVKNEFREEHYRRIEYANNKFGRDTGSPGWKTDRGKYYILLGPLTISWSLREVCSFTPANSGAINQTILRGFHPISTVSFSKRTASGITFFIILPNTIPLI